MGPGPGPVTTVDRAEARHQWQVHAGGKITRIGRDLPPIHPGRRRRSDVHRAPIVGRIYVATICAAGAATLAFAFLAVDTTHPLALATFLAMSLIASMAKVEIAVLGSGATLTACHIADLLALIIGGPHTAVLVSAFSGWMQCTFGGRRNPVHQTLFSIAALALSMGAAGLLYSSLGGGSGMAPLDLKPFAAAATVFFVLNSGLVAGAVSLSTGDTVRSVWSDFALSVWPSYLIGAGLSAVLAIGLQEQDYWLVPLLAATLAVLHRNYQACIARMNDGITDELTGLPNKRFAADYIERELARARRRGTHVAMVLLDMDGFKRINDVGGHTAGDRALRHVGGRLARGLRTTDLCARYGGDEFLIVLPGCGDADARRRVKEMQHDVTESGREAHFDSALSLSAGVALFPADGTTFDELFATADARMYRSKFDRRIG